MCFCEYIWVFIQAVDVPVFALAGVVMGAKLFGKD